MSAPSADGRSSGGSKSFDIRPDGRFEVTIGPLTESIVVDLAAGDAVAPSVPVTVVTPPELASIKAVHHYPVFTGRAPDEVQSGDVRALVGTRVELAFRADRPVERAEIVFLPATHGVVDGAVPSTTQPASGAVEMSSPLAGSTSFVVRHRGRYQIVLHDADGFASDTPATFVIDPVENQLPEVALRRPGGEHRVTPGTRLGLEFDASDDYGVTEAAIHWRKRATAATGDDATMNVQPILPASPQRTWKGRFVWDLGGLGVQAGDEIVYFLQVVDAGEHLTGEKSARTGLHTLQVMDPESLRRSLEDTLERTLGEVDAVGRQQATGMDALALAILSLPGEDDPTHATEARRIRNEANRQLGIRRQVERIAQRMVDVADELAESFLAEPRRIAELREVADGLRALTGEPMQQVIDRLEAARAALAPAGTEGR